MAKRFTDTDKWDDDWFLGLPPRMKCVWEMLRDTCCGIGTKKLSFLKLSRDIGEPITREEFDFHFGERVHWLNHDTVWIHGFIRAQHKKLYPTNKAHLNIALKALRIVEGQDLSSKAQGVVVYLKDFVQGSVEVQAEPERTPPGVQADSIGNRKKEIGNILLEGSVRGDFPPQENWPFEEPDSFYPVAAELQPIADSAVKALRTVPTSGQRAWLTAYPDPRWVRQEILSCLAHLALKRPKSPYTTFGSFLGNWLGNNWKKRRPEEVGTDPVQQFLDGKKGGAA